MFAFKLAWFMESYKLYYIYFELVKVLKVGMGRKERKERFICSLKKENIFRLNKSTNFPVRIWYLIKFYLLTLFLNCLAYLV